MVLADAHLRAGDIEEACRVDLDLSPAVYRSPRHTRHPQQRQSHHPGAVTYRAAQEVSIPGMGPLALNTCVKPSVPPSVRTPAPVHPAAWIRIVQCPASEFRVKTSKQSSQLGACRKRENAHYVLQRVPDHCDIVVLAPGTGRALRGSQSQLPTGLAQELPVAVKELRGSPRLDLIAVRAVFHQVDRGTRIRRQRVDGRQFTRPLGRLALAHGADCTRALTRHEPFW